MLEAGAVDAFFRQRDAITDSGRGDRLRSERCAEPVDSGLERRAPFGADLFSPDVVDEGDGGNGAWRGDQEPGEQAPLTRATEREGPDALGGQYRAEDRNTGRPRVHRRECTGPGRCGAL